MVNPGCDPGVTSKGPRDAFRKQLRDHTLEKSLGSQSSGKSGSLYSDLDYLDYLDPFWFLISKHKAYASLSLV